MKKYLVLVECYFCHGNPEFNLFKPNVNYSGRTAPLTSKVAFYTFIHEI